MITIEPSPVIRRVYGRAGGEGALWGRLSWDGRERGENWAAIIVVIDEGCLGDAVNI